MGNKKATRRIVQLENVRKNNIVTEDLNENILGSVFVQEYKKAARVIRQIIKENQEHSQDTNTCRHCRNQNCSTCTNSVRHKYKLTEFHTAVPFIGDRGTGKSSIMCSVLDYLRKYRGDRTVDALKLETPQHNPRFITFDMIDANTLNSSEDVMEIILSRMLTYLEELHPHADDFRELYRMIDELHKDLSLVYWKQTECQEYGLMGLQKIADSQKSITRFRMLVDRFNKDVSRCHFDNNPCYLVIALDDIDMYQGGKNGMVDSQFALLDHIYNHMRIPGLIVLMTYNERMLRRRCNAHFTKIYFDSQKTIGKITPFQQKDIDELTAQFMSKLFPQERRVYMPNYQYVDSGNRPNLYVSPKNPQKEPDLLQPFTSEEELPVKDFMLQLIAHKTGVYFDAAGTKQHFLEPRNLRELGELFELIYSMEEPTETPNIEDQKWIRDSNCQELLNYLYNHFALKRLATDEYREFRNLSMLPIVRQGRTLVDNIRDMRGKYVMRGHFGYVDPTTHDRWRYSYGELLRNIHYSTRISTGSHTSETIYSKEFVRCILGTHSVLLNQINHESSLTGSGGICTSDVYDSYKTMLDVIGSSIAGRWANMMLPKFKIGTLEPRPGGSVSTSVRSFFGWHIQENVTDSILKLTDKIDEEDKKIVHQFLEAFLLVGMLFTGFPARGLGICLKPDMGNSNTLELLLQSTSEEHICFNALNFVLNLYDFFDVKDPKREHKGYLSNMIPKLRKLGKDLASELSEDWNLERSKAEYSKMDAIEKYNSDPYADLHKNTHEATIDNYGKIIDRTSAWITWRDTVKFSKDNFINNWNAIVDEVVSNFRSEIKSCIDSDGIKTAVLPIQHFDMMYNITKRLANVAYHDIPDDAPIEDIRIHYTRLYQHIVEELEAQDKLYNKNAPQYFADTFRECIFYKAFNAADDARNPFIDSFLVNMLSKAIVAKAEREKVGAISFDHFA